jgi:hypothetical protein
VLAAERGFQRRAAASRQTTSHRASHHSADSAVERRFCPLIDDDIARALPQDVAVQPTLDARPPADESRDVLRLTHSTNRRDHLFVPH